LGQDGADDYLIGIAILIAAESAGSPPLAKALESIGCPRGAHNEIVVCRRGDAGERYRIPEALRSPGFDPKGPIASVSRERNGLMDAGAGGVTECSNVGTAGHAGCQIKQFRAWKEQKAGR